jgi:hypothetical protein
MEQFYQLLREYNKIFAKSHSYLPEWFLQYTEELPPLYWKTVYQIMNEMDKNKSIVEIGAGYGDITALLYFMGFNKVVSFECDSSLCSEIIGKIESLFERKPLVINTKYPDKLNFTPDILLQVNCVYADTIKSKEEYLTHIINTYEANGVPQTYLLEVIDNSYKEANETFPELIRLNKADIRQLFPASKITAYKTYIYPHNKVSKTLYCICR